MSEQLFDDTQCFMCGRKLLETSDPADTAFDGYCDQDCVDGKSGINSVVALARAYFWDGGDHTKVEGILDASGYMTKRLFKDTSCGVAFSVHKDVTGVSVSGYVEGLDVECPVHNFLFPFHIDDFNAAVAQCDAEANEILNEAEAEL